MARGFQYLACPLCEGTGLFTSITEESKKAGLEFLNTKRRRRHTEGEFQQWYCEHPMTERANNPNGPYWRYGDKCNMCSGKKKIVLPVKRSNLPHKWKNVSRRHRWFKYEGVYGPSRSDTSLSRIKIGAGLKKCSCGMYMMLPTGDTGYRNYCFKFDKEGKPIDVFRNHPGSCNTCHKCGTEAIETERNDHGYLCDCEGNKL